MVQSRGIDDRLERRTRLPQSLRGAVELRLEIVTAADHGADGAGVVLDQESGALRGAPVLAHCRDAAIDGLLAIHAAPTPEVLDYDGSTWPLLTYDDLALKTAHDIFVEWQPKFRDIAFDEAALAEWEAIWAPIRARGEAGATVFCHRDYHAENLIWLPERQGAARVGMLDFQDAVLAHPAWDLSMLLHDARRTVSPEREAACLDRYLAARPELDRTAFLADYHALGALNIIRILGIFARLVTRDGKPRYAEFIPRLWVYLDVCFADPALADLKAWFDRHVPVETRR